MNVRERPGGDFAGLFRAGRQARTVTHARPAESDSPADIEIAVAVPPALLECIAARAAEIVSESRSTESEPWLGVAEAAAHLACPKSRVYDLVGLGRLRPRRDGRRLLFRRSWLDEYLEETPR